MKAFCFSSVKNQAFIKMHEPKQLILCGVIHLARKLKTKYDT